MRRITSGRESHKSSLQPSLPAKSSTERLARWIMVPIAPSNTSTRFWAAASRGKRSQRSSSVQRRGGGASLRQRQDLAALIHLCGAGVGDLYVQRGFRLTPGQRCGDHDVARYLAQVNGLKRQFLRLAAIG